MKRNRIQYLFFFFIMNDLTLTYLVHSVFLIKLQRNFIKYSVLFFLVIKLEFLNVCNSNIDLLEST